jgi:hypothetical protein
MSPRGTLNEDLGEIPQVQLKGDPLSQVQGVAHAETGH